jgi:Zn-dependent M28 family amino/carboxypeptidase
LYEADDFIEQKLQSYGYNIEKESVPVQAFQPDPLVKHGFRKPLPNEQWYDAFNFYAKKEGNQNPQELIILISHKDSQSWLGKAPGAYDNGVGVAANLEMARILASYQSRRSIWFLFCNEEHWPWTSVQAAQKLANSNYKVVAVLNVDGIGGKSIDDKLNGKMVNVTRYVTQEGEKIADLISIINEKYKIGLVQSKYKSDEPNDDDGSFIKAGITAAVMNIGSYPFADPAYHTKNDLPENVDPENVKLSTQLMLATVLHIDKFGIKY